MMVSLFLVRDNTYILDKDGSILKMLELTQFCIAANLPILLGNCLVGNFIKEKVEWLKHEDRPKCRMHRDDKGKQNKKKKTPSMSSSSMESR